MKYESAKGFKLDPDTNVVGAVSILSSALGEDVELSLRCYVCGFEACPGCGYLDVCDRRRVSSFCLCAEHARGEGGYEAYALAMKANL